ncbi:MAG: PA0069 family radical SAM protein [Betaproteobacteria bacterium]|nr:MAG: PA0069 family radical SAM protein [Betaproteobacteria bacterium]
MESSRRKSFVRNDGLDRNRYYQDGGLYKEAAGEQQAGLRPDGRQRHKGRGTGINPEGRFEQTERQRVDDGWATVRVEERVALKTQTSVEHANSIITRNRSPDVPFNYSINPYRGCEHGCTYCFARPTHAYLNLSPGLDFETRLIAKVNAAQCLERELSSPRYVCETIAMGTNTDPYQPIERKYGITRSLLEVAARYNQPIGIVTKNALVERDLDLLAPMAKRGLVAVHVSVTTLDHRLARRMEPRASAPSRRIEAIRRLSDAGVPVGVMFAPVIPFLTDSALESVLEAAAHAGATQAGYILLRLPYEVKHLFRDWLEDRFPLKAAHVMSRVHAMRDGRDNDPGFGSRMVGRGEFAELLGKRFRIACRRFGLNLNQRVLDTSQFRRPERSGQMDLFQ